MGKHAITNTARIDAMRDEFMNRWADLGMVATVKGDRVVDAPTNATEKAERAVARMEEIHPHIVNVAMNSLHTTK
jgi:hypothetical protein